jgi:hypothetical protein
MEDYWREDTYVFSLPVCKKVPPAAMAIAKRRISSSILTIVALLGWPPSPSDAAGWYHSHGTVVLTVGAGCAM